MKRLCLFWGILLVFSCWLIVAPAQAAGVVVEAEGISDVLANEFRDIAGQVGTFYQEVYKYSPAKNVRIVVVPDEAAYAQRLQREGIGPDAAVRLAKSSGGVSLGTRGLIIIPADKNPRYLNRIRTVTHELFHEMQAELDGGISPHRWLTEGSAKLSEMVLLGWLDKGSPATHRAGLINVLVNVKLMAAPTDLVDGTKWTSLVEQKMYPYEISELMTEYLQRQAGAPQIVQYFRYLGQTRNREAAFRNAFGMTHGQFVIDYAGYFAQEAATKGKLMFETEGEVASDVDQAIRANGAAVEKLLRDQGWRLNWSQRYVIVPSKEAMLKVLRREQPLADEDRHAEIAKVATVAGFGGVNYVFDTGKAVDAEKRIRPLAIMAARSAMVMTAHPAPVTGLFWLYEGTAQMTAARAAESSGIKSLADMRQGWINAIGKAGSPALTEMKTTLAPAAKKYGNAAVTATVALAAARLQEKSPDAIVRYFVVLKDLNDAPRAFQQIFGMTPEAFSAEFAEYAKTLK